MRYRKPPLTVEQQVTLLLDRGMVTDDAERMARKLTYVNYYRLSAYWHPFREAGSDRFRPGTRFETVWNLYRLDRRLRLLMLDAIERIEVAVKTLVAQQHAQAHGPFGYHRDPRSLPKMSEKARLRFLGIIDEERKRSREAFVTHYDRRYTGDADALPVWMVVELLPFGVLSRFYQGCSNPIQARIATSLGTHQTVLTSWIRLLNDVRNTCAHHQRLWNRVHRRTPKLPKRWRVSYPPDRLYALLSITSYLLSRIAPGSSWGTRVAMLLDAHPEASQQAMGFPDPLPTKPRWAVDVILRDTPASVGCSGEVAP